MEEENVDVIQLLYTDEEVDRYTEEKIGEVVQLLYGDKKVDRRIEWFPGGMQSGMHDLLGKIKGLRFSP
jgi:hypothetical protein